MTYDFTTELANLMCENDKELPKRLRDKKRKLNILKCTNESLGRWLDDFELPVLIETLNLPDKYFHKKFAGLPSFDHAKRSAFATKLQKHSETCDRCRSKVLFDRQWEETVDRSIFQHKETLMKVLSKEKTSSEPDHYEILQFPEETIII